MVKVLKLEVRKFCGLISTFVEVNGDKPIGVSWIGLKCPDSSLWNQNLVLKPILFSNK